MVKVKVLVDGFRIGLTAHEKGSTFETSIPAANYLVGQGTCERVKKAAKKVPRKKATYKTRDIVSGD